ncbi:MAG TPA: hypothetical protein V6C65_18850 [Allocoleopsis sp.]
MPAITIQSLQAKLPAGAIETFGTALKLNFTALQRGVTPTSSALPVVFQMLKAALDCVDDYNANSPTDFNLGTMEMVRDGNQWRLLISLDVPLTDIDFASFIDDPTVAP